MRLTTSPVLDTVHCLQHRTIHCSTALPTVSTWINALYENTKAKYLIDGCHQRFVPTSGACLAYQPLRSLSDHYSNTGRISVILDMLKPITLLITQHFHHTLSAHQYSPLDITPYKLIYRSPRSASNSKPAFIQCGRHSGFGAIFGLSPPDLTPYITTYCNLVPHYINSKLTEIGAQDLLSIVPTTKAITEFS